MSNATSNVSAGRILKYMTLPGIKPRFVEMFGHGFHYIPYFIALVYECVRLIPKGHPYLNARNIGRFGVRDVIAEAANNLVLSKKNIDQIAVFLMVIVAMVIVCVQIVLVALALFMPTAMAMPTNFSEFFVPGGYPGTATEQDLALILLDMVFGVPEMFESCVDQVANPGAFCEGTSGDNVVMPSEVADLLSAPGPNAPAFTHWAEWPYPLHEGLHQLFAVYSYGLLIIAVLITIYFIITILVETAQTGTAFGKRFNKVWVPLRIVVAFGLLVPLTIGLNSGQYIVLYAAKYGSGFASNGWAYFNTTFTGSNPHYLSGWKDMVAVPNYPEFTGLAQFFFTAAACKAYYVNYRNDHDWTENHRDPFHIVPYVLTSTGETVNHLPLTNPAGAIPSAAAIQNTTPYGAIMATGQLGYRKSRLILRFGHRSTTQPGYSSYLGRVKPICGEIVINFEDSREPGVAEPGAEKIQRFYWWLLKALWWSEGRLETGVTNVPYAENVMRSVVDPAYNPATHEQPTEEFRRDLVEAISEHMRETLDGDGGPENAMGGNAVDLENDSAAWNLTPEILEKGWAGAALWYTKIAQMNGAVISATFSIPVPSLYPEMLEYTAEMKTQFNQNTTPMTRFDPIISEEEGEIPYPTPEDRELAQIMYKAFQFWNDAASAASTQTDPTGNIVIDTINFIFGTDGLFEMRKNTDVHPLAQLVGIGRSLVEASIRNIGYAAIGAAAGGFVQTLFNFGGALMGTASSFLVTIAMVGMTAGFILYYIIPFLPFIYFFFAVGGWIKGIFEAMVGVPLWALAHIRIDGEGLSGQAALNGYFLIFEIFLRPILILFGFLASIIIFASLVEVLNDIFTQVVANVGGFDMAEERENPMYIEYYRSAIDEFFYTIIYAVLVYMIGMSCFKLVDQIPSNILRWMNQNVSTFSDNRDDAAQNLVGIAHTGAQQGLTSVKGGLQSMIGAVTR